jgi:hypothetical protein
MKQLKPNKLEYKNVESNKKLATEYIVFLLFLTFMMFMICWKIYFFKQNFWQKKKKKKKKTSGFHQRENRKYANVMIF